VVLLPGCKCCATCGWPLGDEPDSIEVVLEDTAARTYTVTQGSDTWTYYIPSLNGTFSLAKATPGDSENWTEAYYIYKGTSNGSKFQVGWFRDLLSLEPTWPNWDTGLALSTEVRMTNPTSPTVPESVLEFGGRAFLVRCTKSNGETKNYPFSTVPPFFPTLNSHRYRTPLTNDSSSLFESGCYVPGKSETEILHRTDFLPCGTDDAFCNPTSHTFPLSKTVAGNTTIGWRFSVRVVSVSCVYGSESIPTLVDQGQTSCPPTS